MDNSIHRTLSERVNSQISTKLVVSSRPMLERGCSAESDCRCPYLGRDRHRLPHSDRQGGQLVLIMLIGGRIIPSFTRNWLVRENPSRLPAPFGRFDAIAIAIGALALCTWILIADQPFAGMAPGPAALAHGVRLARWAGERSVRDRLVLVLHVAYAFVPLGFALAALAAFGLAPQSEGIHAWMAGAAGTMTLAVMRTRAKLREGADGAF